MLTSWLDRCIKRFNETEPLYGYQQSLFLSFRAAPSRNCAAKQPNTLPTREPTEMPSADLPWRPTEVMYEMIEVVNEILPKDKPRYLMGVGTPQNILEAIERGVDMFDCVMPTRNGATPCSSPIRAR